MQYRHIKIIPIIILIFFCTAFACHFLTTHGEDNLAQDITYQHIIRTNRDGVVIDLKDDKKRLNKDEYEKYANNILTKAEELGKVRGGTGTVTVKILIHVHGGLVKYKDTENRVSKIAQKIKDEESDWHYPIFISWPSDMASSYGEQLLDIRQGVKKKWPINAIGVPFILMSQLGMSIGKIPENWYYQIANFKDNISSSIEKYNWLSHIWAEADNKSGCSFNDSEFKKKPDKPNIEDLCHKIEEDFEGINLNNSIENLNKFIEAPDRYEKFRLRYPNIDYSEKVNILVTRTQKYRSKEYSKLSRKKQINIQRLNRLLVEETYPNESPISFDIYRSEFIVANEEYLKRYGLRSVMFPSRATIGGVVHSTFGDASWKNMKRRTSNILYPLHFFDTRYGNGVAGGEFFRLLLDRISNNNKYAYEITLVGHSMGSIILNKVLSNFQMQWKDTKALKNIVYMAAACSINEAKDAVIPLMLSIQKSSASDTPHFYNLTLNRIAETDECVGYYSAPSGTLLEYIDSHYEKPEMHLDRTLGKEVNVLASIHVFDEIKPYVHFKSFDRYTGRMPMGHGDFNKCEFWKKDFWSTETVVKDDLRKYPFVINCYENKK